MITSMTEDIQHPMKTSLLVSLFATLIVPAGIFAQNLTTGHDGPFQVNYAANLQYGDSALNFTNTGANSYSNICLNLYLFSPDEQMQACCTCTLTPNGLYSAALLQGLLANPAFVAGPGSYLSKYHSAVVKAVATGAGATPCGAGNSYGTTDLAWGLAAWGTHYHITALGTQAITETPFTLASLSTGELNSLTSRCAFFIANGSGEGICNGCPTSGLQKKASLTPTLGTQKQGS